MAGEVTVLVKSMKDLCQLKLTSRTISYALLMAGCCAVASCRKQTASQPTTGPYDSNYLHSALQPGVDRQTVLDRFGPPLDETPVEGDRTCLTYDRLIPVREIRKPTDFIGFQVILRSNVVQSWSPVLTQHNR